MKWQLTFTSEEEKVKEIGSYSIMHKYTKHLTSLFNSMTSGLYNRQGFTIDWRKYHENLVTEALIWPAENGAGFLNSKNVLHS